MNTKCYSQNVKEEIKLGDLSADMTVGLFFDREGGDGMFLLNVGRLSTEKVELFVTTGVRT
jgi:hypothetical protein